MENLLNKTFFKFALGFVVIVGISVAILLLSARYTGEGEVPTGEEQTDCVSPEEC